MTIQMQSQYKSSLLKGLLIITTALACAAGVYSQRTSSTPLQREVNIQKERLTATDPEVRRDALMRLGLMKRPEASQAAARALNDPEASVRVAAAHALVAAPAPDAVSALVPLLQDKLEFVRREVAYALGGIKSHAAVAPLVSLLTTDKEMSVRAAAAVALGRIKDESAVIPLAKVIQQQAPKKKAGEYEFVRRAAVEALGQIHNPAAVQVLIDTLANEKNSIDTRRTAATALGKIGSNSAVPALRAAFNSDDPYLAEAAREALRRLRAPLK